MWHQTSQHHHNQSMLILFPLDALPTFLLKTKLFFILKLIEDIFCYRVDLWGGCWISFIDHSLVVDGTKMQGDHNNVPIEVYFFSINPSWHQNVA